MPSTGTVEIDWRPATDSEPTTRQVEAIDTNTPGLAVTRAYFRDPGYERWWTVTHLPTGKHLPTYFPTTDQAVAFANDLAQLTDWTATAPERGPGFLVAYRRAKDRNGGVLGYQLEPDEETKVTHTLVKGGKTS